MFRREKCSFPYAPWTTFLGLSILLSACQSTPNAPAPSALINGTTNVAAVLPTGNWQFAGEASQYAHVQIAEHGTHLQVTATEPGDYLLRNGGQTITFHVEGPVTGQVNLTEVSLNAREGASGWVELYNGTGQPINLRDYAIRAPARDRNGASAGTLTFTLPDQVLEAGEYLLVTGKQDLNAKNGPQTVFIENAGRLPAWQGQGTIELLHGMQAQDTVQFGQNLSASAMGSKGPTLEVASVANDATSSIMRQPTGQIGGQSFSGWVQTVLPSPGAPNNEHQPAAQSLGSLSLRAMGMTDNDGDGIPDNYETSSSPAYNGIYVYNLGARQNQTDIFLEIDWMNSTSNFIKPQRAGLDKMVAAFARAGYALHVDMGNAFSSTFSPANYNLGGGNVVGYSACIGLGFANNYCDGVLSYKYGTTRYSSGTVRNFDIKRLNLFRYAVLGNSQQSDGSNGSSGIAEISGNDFVVTMGGWGYDNLTQVANQQGSTIMHEFGHTLGLRHGGFEDTNNKPNYYSTMNYTYQLAGLDDTADRVWERAKQWRQGCRELTYNTPCMSSFKMDYSYGNGGRMDEGYINENAGINRGNAWIDWNNDGQVSSGIRSDVNGDGYLSSGSYYLADYNDWDNISPTFGYVDPNDASTDINAGARPRPRALPRLDVAANDIQPAIVETNHPVEH